MSNVRLGGGHAESFRNLLLQATPLCILLIAVNHVSALNPNTLGTPPERAGTLPICPYETRTICLCRPVTLPSSDEAVRWGTVLDSEGMYLTTS